MNDIKYGQITEFVHFLIKNSYKDKNDILFIDATAGNGFDTLFLCDLFINNGFVYAFDIQETAISNTKNLLESKFYANYELVNDSHENILNYTKDKEIDAVLFNLGYLPNSNKEIKTNYAVTISAIKSLLTKLKNNGRIYICAYLLHDDGEEARNIFNFISSLNKKEYNVIQFKLINKENSPPEIFIIEKN